MNNPTITKPSAKNQAIQDMKEALEDTTVLNHSKELLEFTKIGRQL